jgi:hypothetical protein
MVRTCLTAAALFLMFAGISEAQTTRRAAPTGRTASPPPRTTSAPPPAAPAPSKPAPTPAGTGTIVTRPQTYWRNYRTDLIRQIFDGGFGIDVDDDDQFQLLYNSYVEAFSSTCSAYLPANRQSVGVRQVRTRLDRNGVVTEDPLVQGTVQADPRFVPKYQQYAQHLMSSSSGLSAALRYKRTGSLGDTQDPGLDAFQFVKTEKCDSPATRQLGENLLRGATGEPPLQRASAAAKPGAPGAAASPTRFTHIVDACNAEFVQNSAYCKCLGEQFSAVLSPDEEAALAADFREQVRYNILQPRGDHPLWGRLHARSRTCAK